MAWQLLCSIREPPKRTVKYKVADSPPRQLLTSTRTAVGCGSWEEEPVHNDRRNRSLPALHVQAEDAWKQTFKVSWGVRTGSSWGVGSSNGTVCAFEKDKPHRMSCSKPIWKPRRCTMIRPPPSTLQKKWRGWKSEYSATASVVKTLTQIGLHWLTAKAARCIMGQEWPDEGLFPISCDRTGPRKLLAKMFQVKEVDEFKTSMSCNTCSGKCTERRMANSHTLDSAARTAQDIQKIDPSGSLTET